MSYVHETLESLRRSSPAQAEFYQAAEEVLESLQPLLDKERCYGEHGILQRIVERGASDVHLHVGLPAMARISTRS